MIDLGNFLKPCDRFCESGRLCTCEKETKGMLKGMKRPHLMPLHDVSTRQVRVGVVGVGVVILYAFPGLLRLQEVEVKAVVENRSLKGLVDIGL